MIKVTEILKYLDDNKIKYIYKGDISLIISSYSPLKSLKNNSITWIRKVNQECLNNLKDYEKLLIVKLNFA